MMNIKNKIIKLVVIVCFFLSNFLNSAVKETYKIESKNLLIHIFKGSILDLKVDAIVNPANPSLRHLGGLCGIIHKAAGPLLEEECLQFPIISDNDIRCNPGQAVITKGYKLNAKFVIHAVGPIWKKDNKDQAKKLADAYKNSLILLTKYELNSIAFPAISSGIYGYPIEDSSRIAIDTIIENCDLFVSNNNTTKEVYFVILSQEHFDLYKKYLDIKVKKI